MSDADARRTAVRSYDRNLVVVAGAGTGKTSLLIERLLNQLIERDLGVHEIAALTFTEKAAAELRGRLEGGLSRLTELARSGASASDIDEGREGDRAYAYLATRVPASALRERAERLIGEIAQASIATIHGYCASLLRQFPAESGVDPDFAIDEGPLFDALRVELWDDFLRGPDGPEGVRRADWQAVLRQLDVAELREIGWHLASYELPAASIDLGLARELLAPIVEEQLRENAAARGAGVPGPESFLVAADRVLRECLAGGPAQLRLLLESVRFESTKGPRGLLESAAPTAQSAPQAQRCAKSTRRLLERLERVDEALFARALPLLARFRTRVLAEARRRNLLPFGALLSLARNLLAAHPEVRRRLGRRLQLLLVDEFQDTDPLQYEIAFFLAEALDGEPAEEAFETRLAPGKLFIVGDPKQAIYRFRGADMTAYHLAVAHVEHSGGQRLTLDRSFRAGPELLEPLDRLFLPLLSAPAEADASAYSGYDPLRSASEHRSGHPCVEVWTAGSDAARSADQARRDEAEAIASWIARESRAGRLSLGDVAILFRAFSSVHLYTGALRDHGIPYALETGRDLLERPEGQQLVSLFRALANPSDAPAVLGVLRSALGATPDPELAAYAASLRPNSPPPPPSSAASSRSAPAPGSAWSYLAAKPDPERFPGLARTYALLCKWQDAALRRPLDAVLSALADEACLLPVHAAAADGAQRLANLRSRLDPLIELARRDPAHTLASLLPWLERSEQPIGPPADRGDELKIMTIHASKGLEFPLVFLPDLARSPRAGARREASTQLHWLRAERCFAASTAGPLSAGALVREAEAARHETAENRRLFYVACTRAAEQLILVHSPRRRMGADAPVHHLGLWGYPPEGLDSSGELPDAADVVHRFVAAPEVSPAVASEARSADLGTGIVKARRIVERARASTGPAFRHPTGLREETELALEQVDDAAAPWSTRAPGFGREVGSVLHEVLERWDFRSAEAASDLLRAAVRRVSRDGGVDPDELERHAASVLRAVLQSDLADYLGSVEILGRELPILFEDEDGTAWSGTIDLLYREGGPDGRLVVADYKTDRDPDAGTRERYRPQLEVYGRGIARAWPDSPPPALELLFLRTGERVRL